MDLSDVDKELLHWGWKIENSNYTLIMTDIEAGPPEVLYVVVAKTPVVQNSVVEKQGYNAAVHGRNVIDLYVQMHQ